MMADVAEKTRIGDWLERMFVQWQAAQGKSKTIQEFFDFLEISKATYYRWGSGERTPTELDVASLAKKTGNYDIYELAGLEKPDPRLEALKAGWENIPDDIKDEIADIAGRAKERGATEPSDRKLASTKRK